MELDVGIGSITKMGQISDGVGYEASLFTENALIESMSQSEITYSVQLGSTTFDANDFSNPNEADSNHGSSNPSELHDMG